MAYIHDHEKPMRNETCKFLLAIILLLGAQEAAGQQGTSVVVESESEFGFFLPPAPDLLIGNYESNGIAFCTDPSAYGTSCQPFPAGFIQSAHFYSSETYVQVTGRIDGSVYTDPTDEGGQYDHLNSPVGGQCFGYSFFVNLVEPANGDYCIRCCLLKADCPTGKSTQGCAAVIPGDYS